MEVDTSITDILSELDSPPSSPQDSSPPTSPHVPTSKMPPYTAPQAAMLKQHQCVSHTTSTKQWHHLTLTCGSWPCRSSSPLLTVQHGSWFPYQTVTTPSAPAGPSRSSTLQVVPLTAQRLSLLGRDIHRSTASTMTKPTLWSSKWKSYAYCSPTLCFINLLYTSWMSLQCSYTPTSTKRYMSANMKALLTLNTPTGSAGSTKACTV